MGRGMGVGEKVSNTLIESRSDTNWEDPLDKSIK